MATKIMVVDDESRIRKLVKDFLQKETGIRRVIFNVFKDSDLEIYQRLLT